MNALSVRLSSQVGMFAESQCVVIYITKTALINGSVKIRYARTAGKLIVMMIYTNGKIIFRLSKKIMTRINEYIFFNLLFIFF